MSLLEEKSKLRTQEFCKEVMYLPMFPEAIDNEISTADFLAASKQALRILDYFGKIFMPVKYDMQKNIDKLAKKFNLNRQNYATLQKMLLDEKKQKESPIIIDALLWLKRGLHMIQLFFEFIVSDYNNGTGCEDLVAKLCKAYELTLEPYHGYMAQQLFSLLSRMIPTRTQILKAIANGYHVNQEKIIKNMDYFSNRLKETIATLKLFYDEHNLEFNDNII